MFNLFNESSVLPEGALLIEKEYAKEIVESVDFKVLLVKCVSDYPSTPRRYNILIGDYIYALAKKLTEQFAYKIDCITDLKFEDCFKQEVYDRTLPVNRCIIEKNSLNIKQRKLLWKHDLKLSGIILKELLKIKRMAKN